MNDLIAELKELANRLEAEVIRVANQTPAVDQPVVEQPVSVEEVAPSDSPVESDSAAPEAA